VEDAGVIFEWDDGKARGNLAKHGLPFEVATVVFLDADRIDFDASQPGQGESRRKVVGMIEGLLFTVVYTRRGEVIRLISARRANRMETQRYG
jgi:uncharacterized DUF497 family protein